MSAFTDRVPHGSSLGSAAREDSTGIRGFANWHGARLNAGSWLAVGRLFDAGGRTRGHADRPGDRCRFGFARRNHQGRDCDDVNDADPVGPGRLEILAGALEDDRCSHQGMLRILI